MWNRRNPITVTNGSGAALSDYQVKVTVTYDADMQADFADLRFTTDDGETLCPHWIESCTASTSAVVWVRVPTLAAGTTTIYMYYGHGSVDDGSSKTITLATALTSAPADTVEFVIVGRSE